MPASVRSAYSLLELCVTLLLLAVLLGLAAPPVRRALTRARVRSAREVVAMELARTRALAVAHGGAALVLDLPRARAWVESGGTTTPPVVVADDRLLRVSADGAAGDTIRIAFDALGLGHIASRTLRFRSGDLEARLTVSSYGRVRSG